MHLVFLPKFLSSRLSYFLSNDICAHLQSDFSEEKETEVESVYILELFSV